MGKTKKQIASLGLALALSVTSVVTANPVSVSAPTKSSGTVKSVTVSNLPAKTLTLAKGKSKALNVKVSVTKKASTAIKAASSNKKVATVKVKGSKVTVTAKKKAGTAKVTITSKANKKKKVTIAVTVGTPVTKVKLNKTKASLTVGKSLTLKATVTPKKPSNKNIVWTTSNKKVATVSAKGVVKAVKKGTATITATAADGSGKKATCKVTVKAAESAAPGIGIADVSILGAKEITVTLTGAQALSAENFVIKTKAKTYGTFNHALGIESVTTLDSVNYVIDFDKNSRIYESYTVQVSVPALKGTNVFEKQYLKNVNLSRTLDDSSSWTLNEYGKRPVYFDFDDAEVGYLQLTGATGLPAGIQIIEKDDMIYLIGTPTQVGTFPITITAVDEVGNTFSLTHTMLVGSENAIAAYISPYYTVKNADDVLLSSSTNVRVIACGGSDNYIYTIDPNVNNLSIDSEGYINGTIKMAGDYDLIVHVTDNTNPAVTTTVGVTLHIIQGNAVTGVVNDITGAAISGAQIYFSNQDRTLRYNGDKRVITDSNGAYAVNLVPGVYDVTVMAGAESTYYYGVSYTAATSAVFTVNAYKIAVNSTNPLITFDNNIWSTATWTDKNTGDDVGTGSTLYLKAGNYSLTTSGSVKVVGDYSATLDISVTTSAVVLATVTTKKVIPTIAENVTNTGLSTYEYYSFTPSQTAIYYFYSPNGSSSGDFSLYNASGEELLSSRDAEIPYGYTLTGGQNYYVYTYRTNLSIYSAANLIPVTAEIGIDSASSTSVAEGLYRFTITNPGTYYLYNATGWIEGCVYEAGSTSSTSSFDLSAEEETVLSGLSVGTYFMEITEKGNTATTMKITSTSQT